MSDETTIPPVADEAPTAPLPQATAEQPQASVAAAPAPGAPTRSATGMYVFAVAAAVVLAVGLSAVSFGAGVFVGRVGGSRQNVAAGAPGLSGGIPAMPGGRQGYGQGWGGEQGTRDGDANLGAPRGHGRMRGGFPGQLPTAPDSGATRTLPDQQSAPETPDTQ